MRIELKDILGPLLTSAALFWGVYQYRATTYSDFIKPMRDSELLTYQKLVETAALVATLPKGSPEKEKSSREFILIYDGLLAMVQDFDHGPRLPAVKVAKAATNFKTCLERPDCRDDAQALANLSRALAYTCRESLRDSWRYAPTNFDQTHKNVIDEYAKKFQLEMQEQAVQWDLRSINVHSSGLSQIFVLYILAFFFIGLWKLARVWSILFQRLGGDEGSHPKELNKVTNSVVKWTQLTFLLWGLYVCLSIAQTSRGWFMLNSHHIAVWPSALHEVASFTGAMLFVVTFTFVGRWWVEKRASSLPSSIDN